MSLRTADCSRGGNKGAFLPVTVKGSLYLQTIIYSLTLDHQSYLGTLKLENIYLCFVLLFGKLRILPSCSVIPAFLEYIKSPAFVVVTISHQTFVPLST